jgi:hypothetical protein
MKWKATWIITPNSYENIGKSATHFERTNFRIGWRIPYLV